MLQGCSVGDWSSAFGAFAETLRILITDVNDNTPVFKPISETFGEQLGLVHPVGSSLCPHMLCHHPSSGDLPPARAGLCEAQGQGLCGGTLRALLSLGAVWLWGLQQVWLHTSMTTLSASLSLAVVVPEISVVDLQVATVTVRSCVCAVSLWSQAHPSPPWESGGHTHPCSCHAFPTGHGR